MSWKFVPVFFVNFGVFTNGLIRINLGKFPFIILLHGVGILMQIAQVAPLIESVPPQLYGGTERVVSYLTEELVRQGHDVTLFASGDSTTSARLNAGCLQALRLSKTLDPLPLHMLMLERVAELRERFDIIHFHTGFLHYPLCRRLDAAHITTHHGRLDLPDSLGLLLEEFKEIPVISISHNQRLPVPNINWRGNISHGLPKHLYRFNEKSGTYLAFLGRISPEKRVDRAIEIAIEAGMDIKIAAKVDKVDIEYFESKIKPLLNHPRVEFIGEINEAEKDGFLGNAYALVFPIEWPEPFGLVMIEAMACGTPTIAYRRGAIPEVLQHGVTGYIVDNQQQAVAAVERITDLDRHTCRQVFETDYTVERMARDYVSVYKKTVEKSDNQIPDPRLAA